jgi:hypothetical protein
MATVYGKSMADLGKFMEKQIISWLIETGDKLHGYLKDFIYSEYYGQYIPSEYYERQYRIVDAITVTSIKKVGNTYYLEIYLDPSKVSYDSSVWYDKGAGTWNYIKGDTSEDVFNLIANGIHGWEENSQTSGRFWESFLESIGHGGIYDLFEDFKKSLNGKGLLTIR